MVVRSITSSTGMVTPKLRQVRVQVNSESLIDRLIETKQRNTTVEEKKAKECRSQNVKFSKASRKMVLQMLGEGYGNSVSLCEWLLKCETKGMPCSVE